MGSSGSRNHCGKLSFRTKDEAKRARRKVRKSRGRHIYLCRYCGMFHLTTMTLTEQEQKGLR